jgi:hypothetical protein
MYGNCKYYYSFFKDNNYYLVIHEGVAQVSSILMKNR